MQITLTARELHDLLKPVLPLAHQDDMLPVLNAVLVESRGGYLTATASDRYRIGICRRPHDGGDFRALVRLADVRSILALFKPSRRSDNSLTLTIEGSRIYAEASGGLGFNFSDMRVGYELQVGEFPGVKKLFCQALANEPAENAVGLSSDFLADWRHAGSTLEFKVVGHDEPVIVRSGDHFLGLVMPKRLVAGESAPADDWADFLADKKKPAAKKAPSKPRAKKKVA